MIQHSHITGFGSDFLSLEVALSHSAEKGGSRPDAKSSTMVSILVVDDDADMRSYISDCLSDYYGNVHVMEAKDGQAAFEVLQNVKPALLITDLNMPGMNGLELISAIIGNFTEWNVPVLIISGKDQHPAANPKVRELPSWSILKKPFSEELLIGHVRRLLNPKS